MTNITAAIAAMTIISAIVACSDHHYNHYF
jgi:hypothetical protein